MSAPSSYNKADIVTVAIPVAASVYMAYKANKKKSLTVNGCWTALGVGSVIGVLGGGGTSMVQKLLSSREVTGTFTNGDTEPQQLLPFLALLNFFYTSTYLTKKGKQIKEKEIRVVSEEAYEASGNRTATQVLCNGGVAAGLALIVHACRMLKNSGFIASSSAGASVSSTSGLLSSVCSSPATCINYFATIPNTVLALALIAQIAAAQGDTWSSELGVLSKSPYAYLIVGGRQVPKGTNGGVTLLGTAAAVGAGLQLGVTLAITQFCAMASRAIARRQVSALAVAQYVFVKAVKSVIPIKLMVAIRYGVPRMLKLFKPKRGSEGEPAAANSTTVSSATLDDMVNDPSNNNKYASLVIPVAITGTTLIMTCVSAAVGGSLIDSLLGQFLQESREVVVVGGDVPSSVESKQPLPPTAVGLLGQSSFVRVTSQSAPAIPRPQIPNETIRISGYDVLTNHTVNLVSVLIVTAATVGFLHRRPSYYE